MVQLICPDCTTAFDGQPGSIVSCPTCGFHGGRVPGTAPARTVQAAQGAYTAFQERLGAPGEEGELEEETSRSAIASLVLGLAFFVPPAGIVALMFGLIALGQIKESKQRPDKPDLKGKGLAIAGIVLGGIFQAAWFILVIMALAGIGNFLEAAGL